jgi:hypothetical protein
MKYTLATYFGGKLIINYYSKNDHAAEALMSWRTPQQLIHRACLEHPHTATGQWFSVQLYGSESWVLRGNLM